MRATMVWSIPAKRSPAIRAVEDYVVITLGALVAAAGVDLFLTPNHVISAGVTGIAMLLHYTVNWPVGLLTLAINVPLFLAAIRWGSGMKSLVKTLYATVVMSLGIDLQPFLLRSRRPSSTPFRGPRTASASAWCWRPAARPAAPTSWPSFSTSTAACLSAPFSW
jgi:uncharacterized membrane-anchored protein YitT (DUF2179 family)